MFKLSANSSKLSEFDGSSFLPFLLELDSQNKSLKIDIPFFYPLQEKKKNMKRLFKKSTNNLMSVYMYIFCVFYLFSQGHLAEPIINNKYSM